MLQFDQPSLGTPLTDEKSDESLINNNNNNNNNISKNTNKTDLTVGPRSASGPTVAPVTSSPPSGAAAASLGDTPSFSTNMSGGGAPTELSTPPTNPNTTTATTGSNNGTVVKQCAGCGAKIMDRFLLHAMDRYWHTGCLKCSCCQAQLGEIGTSCFAKSGMILCKNDYIRLFGSSGMCATCNQSIPASEFVMRAQNNVYHMNCFTCVACHNRLVPGDRFSLVNGSLICEHDYPKFARSHSSVPLRSSHKVC